MIEINNISKVFRTSEVETVALNHVSLDVKEGEFVAIMGPSGCGKSTLLKNVTSDYHYHTICADSEDILDAIEKELKNYGFLVSPKS
mgnify:CR=1 FL=1